jgi:hypothetical protein
MNDAPDGRFAEPDDTTDELGPCPVCGAVDWRWFGQNSRNVCFCMPCGTVIGSLSNLFNGGDVDE